ncbi:MAG: HlyD family secretion protein [Deltaproteobacteria bacterium]
MKRNKIIILGVFLILAASYIMGCNSSNARYAHNKTITGTIEAKEITIASKLPGRVIELKVEENQKVKAGDIIAILSSDELKAKEQQAKALVDGAKVLLEQAKESVALQEKIAKSNIDKAYAGLDAANYQYEKAKKGARNEEIAQAQSAYDVLKKTYERVKYLAEKGAVSQQKADEVKAQMDIAKERLDIAKDAVRPEDLKTAESMVQQVKASVDAANTGNMQVELAKQNVEAAQAKYDQAFAGLQEVRAYLKDTTIVSPIDGTITLLNTKQGELVSTGYVIATVSDMNDIWADLSVRETELSKIKVGEHVKISISAYKNNMFDGVVSNVDLKPDFAAKRATNERDEQDIMSFSVKVKIKNDGRVRPGLTAYLNVEDK